MYYFGDRSRRNLDSCDVRLVHLLEECIEHFDFSVIEGHRTTGRQRILFNEGKSTLDGIEKKSKHQSFPSLAVDVMPYPAALHGVSVWDDMVRWALFIGKIQGIATQMNINIRCGIDWNNDGSAKDHRFVDAPHIELV